MKISLRRLPNGDIAPQRLVLSVDERAKGPTFTCRVRKETAPQQEKSFIEALLGEKGRAIVAKLNPRFRQPSLRVVHLRGDDR
jgi:hypothetical protein